MDLSARGKMVVAGPAGTGGGAAAGEGEKLAFGPVARDYIRM